MCEDEWDLPRARAALVAAIEATVYEKLRQRNMVGWAWSVDAWSDHGITTLRCLLDRSLDMISLVIYDIDDDGKYSKVIESVAHGEDAIYFVMRQVSLQLAGQEYYSAT